MCTTRYELVMAPVLNRWIAAVACLEPGQINYHKYVDYILGLYPDRGAAEEAFSRWAHDQTTLEKYWDGQGDRPNLGLFRSPVPRIQHLRAAVLKCWRTKQENLVVCHDAGYIYATETYVLHKREVHRIWMDWFAAHDTTREDYQAYRAAHKPIDPQLYMTLKGLYRY